MGQSLHTEHTLSIDTQKLGLCSKWSQTDESRWPLSLSLSPIYFPLTCDLFVPHALFVSSLPSDHLPSSPITSSSCPTSDFSPQPFSQPFPFSSLPQKSSPCSYSHTLISLCELLHPLLMLSVPCGICLRKTFPPGLEYRRGRREMLRQKKKDRWIYRYKILVLSTPTARSLFLQ